MLVFDTNLLISTALQARSRTAADVFALMRHQAFAFSRATFTGFYNVLMREKFDPYITREEREALVKQLEVVIIPRIAFSQKRVLQLKKFVRAFGIHDTAQEEYQGDQFEMAFGNGIRTNPLLWRAWQFAR